MLLLHGGGQTRHSWSGTAQRLAREGWHALSLDLRGHGQSDWSPAGAYDLEDFVRDLVAVARALRAAPGGGRRLARRDGRAVRGRRGAGGRCSPPSCSST